MTGIAGIRKGVKIKDGLATLNNIPYNGKIVMLGEEVPESVRAPLRSIGYEFYDDDKVDVNIVNGKVETIKPIGKSAASRSMMENAQLKFSTEPQKGPQMQFGFPKTPAFTFPGGKPIKF